MKMILNNFDQRNIAIFLLLFTLSGCDKVNSSYFVAEENDTYCQSLIDNSDSEELFAWIGKIDGVQRSLGEIDSGQETEKFVAKLDSLNSKNVWILDVERATPDSSRENSGTLCIEFPENNDDRKRLLEFGNEISERLGFDSVPDKGQRYLFVKLD